MSRDVNETSVSGTHNPLNWRQTRSFSLVLFIAFILFLVFFQGNWGELGIDSDDKLRFVQIRDYLQGQSWFDTNQYRMGLKDSGTDMHWSRIPDIPIIVLTHIFDIFTTQDKALNIAISIWPPLSSLILIFAMLIGANQIRFEGDRQPLIIFTLLLVGIFVATYFRFRPGAIDHHNVQFGFIVLAMAWAMDSQMRASRYALSGLATAVCIAIGPEIYLFAAVICGYVAFNWCVKGQLAKAGVQGFGIGLALGVAIIFLTTVPPKSYALVHCDALSLITVIAAIFGGLGLTLCAGTSHYFGGDESFSRRLIALTALGVVCTVALSFQAPQCLANPLKSLPPEVINLWLNQIEEAKSINGIISESFEEFPIIIGPMIVAVCVLLHSYYKLFKRNGFNSKLWDSDALITLLFLLSAILTLYQVRFWPFARIFVILIFARWIAETYQMGAKTSGSNIKYLLCVVLSVHMSWMLLGKIFEEKNSKQAEVSTKMNISKSSDSTETSHNSRLTDCDSQNVMAMLNSVPEGLIATSSDLSTPILIYTNHKVITGNYHRNWKGISAEIKIATSDLEVAQDLLFKHKIDYLFYCAPSDLDAYSNYNPSGLMGKIKAGDVPNFLHQISDPSLENGRAILFKVTGRN